MAFGLRRAKVLGYLSVQLVSKISNLCDPDPLIHQRHRQTDRQTDGRHAISIPRVCTSASRGKHDFFQLVARLIQYVQSIINQYNIGPRLIVYNIQAIWEKRIPKFISSGWLESVQKSDADGLYS